jgi:hypothetical protein
MAAWDRASAPISRYFDLIEALATGGDERQIVRGFRLKDPLRRRDHVGAIAGAPDIESLKDPGAT